VAVFELRLPLDAAITLILREGEIFVPDQDTVLRTRDHLLIATSDKNQGAVERRLRAVSRAGRLASWYGEDGASEPPGGGRLSKTVPRLRALWAGWGQPRDRHRNDLSPAPRVEDAKRERRYAGKVPLG
jgi:TrkA-C domain